MLTLNEVQETLFPADPRCRDWLLNEHERSCKYLSERARAVEAKNCADLLEVNGYSVDTDPETQALNLTREDCVGYEIGAEEITLLDDTGDFFTLPLNYYALVGYLYVNHFEGVELAQRYEEIQI